MLKIGKYYKVNGDKWRHGSPTNFNANDWHSWLGPCPSCGKRTYNYGGGWRCVGDYCSKSANNPAPSVGKTPDWWNTDINVDLDGDSWCAFYDDFENLMESQAGFGDTPNEAVRNLLLNQ